MTTLALSMIVRDAAASLSACLESARGAVDEMVIADTGSTDDTIAVAQRLGARVISVPWTNHFAEARNRALAAVSADWVLSLDADEQLDPAAHQPIRVLLQNQSVSGYSVTIRNYVLRLEDRLWDRPAKPNDSPLSSANEYPAFVEHENVRLFRRDPKIYFVGRVHESVGPCIQQLGRKIAPAQFLIHHFGLAADAATRAQKNHLYRELGRRKIQEMPDDAQAHLELGLVELDNFANLPEALALFERACHLNPRLGVAWFFQGLTLMKLDRHPEAQSRLETAERAGHRTSFVAETRADVFYNMKQYARALECFELALRRDPGNPLLISKLGLAKLRTDNARGGLQQIRHAVSLKPSLGELHDRLISALVWLDQLEEAAIAAEAKLEAVPSPQPTDFLRAASLWARLQNWARAAAILQVGLQICPEHEALAGGLAEVAQAAGVPQLASCLESTS